MLFSQSLFVRTTVFSSLIYILILVFSIDQARKPVNMMAGEFITTWNTENPGSSGNTEITIPTYPGSTYNYSVDWDNDGIFDTAGVTGNITHDFAWPGIYTIRIEGLFPRIYFNNTGDTAKIISIDQWGDNPWVSMAFAFYGCSNLVLNATDVPDLDGVLFTNDMFRGCSAFNGDVTDWDMSDVWNMGSMFRDCPLFNQDIRGWNVGSAKEMSAMFKNATSFNQNLGNWDIKNVSIGQTMVDMFAGATLSTMNYDSTLIGWSNNPMVPFGVTFHGGNSQYCLSDSARSALVANHGWTITDDGGSCVQSFITTWSITSPGESITIPTTGDGYDYIVEWGDGDRTLSNMGDATHVYVAAGTYQVMIRGDFPRIFFNNSGGDKDKIVSIDQWGAISWTSMENAFHGCSNLMYGATDMPDLSSVSLLSDMFSGCVVFNGDLNNWDLNGVTHLTRMFDGATAFNGNITGWNISTVNNVVDMFRNATSFNQDISGWNTGTIDAFSGMFNGAISFNEDIGGWNTSTAVLTNYMFNNAISFNQDIGGWDMSGVVDMSYMFNGATSFDQNIGTWDVGAVTNMAAMFANAGLSANRYDQLLIGWSSLPSLHNSVPFDAGSSTYCIGGPAKDTLTSVHLWMIDDDGPGCGAPFVTSWMTTSPNEQITVPTTGTGYNYIIDWGDGNVDTSEVGNPMHSYVNAGTHTVSIWGVFPRIYFNNSGDKAKITSIEQWGDIAWESMAFAFYGCSNLTMNATDVPDLSQVTHINDMFRGSTAFNGDVSGWDVSNVQVMGSMFRDCPLFNSDVSSWDVSNVTDFSAMFQNAVSFNQNIGGWDISNATDMTNMFLGATLSTINYDSLLIGWYSLPMLPEFIHFHGGNSQSCAGQYARIALSEDKSWTIYDGGNCNQSFMSTWEVTSPGESITIPTTGGGYNYIVEWGDITRDVGVNGNATHVYELPGTYQVMIRGNFPRIFFNNTGDTDKIVSIDHWGYINWTSMENAFHGCSNLMYGATDMPDLSSVSLLSDMFSGCVVFNGDLNNWDLNGVTHLTRMFDGATAFNGNITGWNISTVNNVVDMFRNATSFNQDISGWNTGTIDAFSGMFNGAISFNEDIGGWNTSTAVLTNYMFNNAISFNQDIGGWDMSGVVDMSYMFNGATSFDQNIGTWDVGAVTNMAAMFTNAGLSTENYDWLLAGWAALPSLHYGVTFDAGSSTYCASASARDTLELVHGWMINDGGSGVWPAVHYDLDYDYSK